MDKQIPQGYHSDLSEIATRIEESQEEMGYLTASLRASILIEAIWPDAFKNGSVRFSGLQRQQHSGIAASMAFTEAWFANNIGRKYLTVAELIAFKPEAKIHDDFSCRGLVPNR